MHSQETPVRSESAKERARVRAGEWYRDNRQQVLDRHRNEYQATLRFVRNEIVPGMLNNAHLQKHALTAAAYKAKWNWSGSLVSEMMAEKLRNRRRGGGIQPIVKPRVTAEQLDAGRKDPRRAIADDEITRAGKFIACLECGGLFRTLRLHLKTHGLGHPGYREKWGYARGTGLSSRSYSEKDSGRANRRRWGRHLRITGLSPMPVHFRLKRMGFALERPAGGRKMWAR